MDPSVLVQRIVFGAFFSTLVAVTVGVVYLTTISLRDRRRRERMSPPKRTSTRKAKPNAKPDSKRKTEEKSNRR